jgi:hypothetical protein
VTHNGITGDEDVELEELRFKFVKSDNSTALTGAEMTATFSAYSIYNDDGTTAGVWDASDTAVTTESTTTSGNTVIFNFADADSDVVITPGSSKTYFFVVTTTASGYITVRCKFDSDGYGSSDWNVVENNHEDSVCTIQEAGWYVTPCVVIPPEFHHLLFPGLAAVFITIVVVRKVHRKKRKSKE